MKKITKFNISLMALILLFSNESLGQNEKKQIVRDPKKTIISNEINDSKETLKQNGNFYIGLEAIYQESNLEGVKSKNPNDYYEAQTSAVSLFSGYDNNDSLKIEGFYSKSNEKNQISNSNIFSTSELKTRTIGVDFKPYLNFDKSSNALLYLIVGLNYNKIETEEFSQERIYDFFKDETSNKVITRKSTVSKFSPNLGLGVEFLFYKNFMLRFQYKRNFLDAKIKNSEVLNKVKTIDTLGIGISHSF